MSTKAIKAILKDKFPMIKFSVTKSDNSSMSVSYSDGPLKSEVRELIGRFQLGTSVSQDDTYDIDNRINGLEQFHFVMIHRA